MDIIKVQNVTKKFKLYHDKGATLKEKVLFKNRSSYEERIVLNDVSLTIKKGETVGLIGQNGCGKSTLLKMLSKIIYPNEGSIEIYGRVSSLIELGAGFHPDMTGRENIYNNASIFGLTTEEIDSKLEEIIAFSELEEFIDNPVRTYSSGMYMRLAFSVAISVNADILLIDEILAVGDINFQKKCFNKLKELKNSGITIVIVSHDTGSIEQLCDMVIWIRNGKIIDFGECKSMINKYLQHMNDERCKRIDDELCNIEKQIVTYIEKEGLIESKTKNRWGNKEVEIVSVKLIDKHGKIRQSFKSKETIKIKIDYILNKVQKNYVFGIAINKEDINYFGSNTLIDGLSITELRNVGTIELDLHKLNLLEGQYSLDVAAHDMDGRAYDYIKDMLKFNVVTELKETGLLHLDHSWNIG